MTLCKCCLRLTLLLQGSERASLRSSWNVSTFRFGPRQNVRNVANCTFALICLASPSFAWDLPAVKCLSANVYTHVNSAQESDCLASQKKCEFEGKEVKDAVISLLRDSANFSTRKIERESRELRAVSVYVSRAHTTFF